MVEEEKIDFEAEEASAQADDDMQELGLGDLESRFVKHPGVGEKIVLDIVKAYKDKNTTATTKTGESFSTALSGVNYKITLETKDGKMYSPPSWEVWGKIRSIMQEKKTMKVKVEIEHKVDGSNATKKAEDIAKLNGVSIEEAQKLKSEAITAKKEKKLYEVKIVE